MADNKPVPNSPVSRFQKNKPVPNSPASRFPQFKAGDKGGAESSADRAKRRGKMSVIRKRIGDNDSGKAWLE